MARSSEAGTQRPLACDPLDALDGARATPRPATARRRRPGTSAARSSRRRPRRGRSAARRRRRWRRRRRARRDRRRPGAGGPWPRRSRSRCGSGRRRRRRRRRGPAGGCPAATRRSRDRRRWGAARAAAANFDENSPKLRCWLRWSISPNVATSQNCGRAAVAEQHLVAVGERQQLGQPVAQPADRVPDRRLAVAGAEVAWRTRRSSACDRLGPDLGRPAPEPAVDGEQLAGDRDVGDRNRRDGLGHRCHYRGRGDVPRNPFPLASKP